MWPEICQGRGGEQFLYLSYFKDTKQARRSSVDNVTNDIPSHLTIVILFHLMTDCTFKILVHTKSSAVFSMEDSQFIQVSSG